MRFSLQIVPTYSSSEDRTRKNNSLSFCKLLRLIGLWKWAALDSNQRLPPCEDGGPTTEGVTDSALTPTPSPVCTRVCTNTPENANADALEAASLGTPPQAADAPNADQGNEGEGIDQGAPLAAIAAAIANLSPADRARLAVLLSRDSQ